MHSLYQLAEQSDVFVDACISDQRRDLLFLSVYGRDTPIQQLQARLHQSNEQGGVDRLTLKASLQDRPALEVMVGDPQRLDKVIGRLPRSGVLGNLVHAWIYDPALLKPDLSAGVGWVLSMCGPMVEAFEAEQSWLLVQELSPVPLLPHWSITVLQHLHQHGACERPAALGPMRALRIGLPEDFTTWVSEQVALGHLGLASTSTPLAPSQRLRA